MPLPGTFSSGSVLLRQELLYLLFVLFVGALAEMLVADEAVRSIMVREARREKTCRIKQGMMQELLTGGRGWRTRETANGGVGLFEM